MRFVLILCVLIPRTSSAAEAQFRFRKDIDRKAAPGEELLAAVLDRDVYAATRDGYADLRVHDEGGAEVPYLLEQATQRQTERVREGCPSEVVSLRDLNGKSLEIIVKLRDKAPSADGLTVVTPLTNYEHRLRVFGSRDDQDWSPLVSDGLIFDYTRYMDVRNGDVSLPANDFRRFKLEIEQVLDQRESPFLEVAARPREAERSNASKSPRSSDAPSGSIESTCGERSRRKVLPRPGRRATPSKRSRSSRMRRKRSHESTSTAVGNHSRDSPSRPQAGTSAALSRCLFRSLRACGPTGRRSGTGRFTGSSSGDFTRKS